MTIEKSPITRRAALTSGGAAVLATAAATTSAAAQNSPYADKDTVGYIAEPYVQQCSTCLHWNNSACRVVDDADNPNGWCQAHTAAAAA